MVLPASHSSLGLSICLLAVVISLSCAHSGNPAVPVIGPDSQLSYPTGPNERNARSPESLGDHCLWGAWTIAIDRDSGTVEILDNRELALHLNVRSILQSNYWCPLHNCIRLQFLNIDETNNIYTTKVTLTNPTWFTGFDVRGIVFYDEKGHDLLNADDFTMLYEPGDDINPFRSFAKTVEQRQFAPYTSHSEIFELYIPPVPKRFLIDFAVDASWPHNCEEPYDIENVGFEGSIFPDDPDIAGVDQGEGLLFAEVYDWQVNISEVTVDTTPITGGITTLTYNSGTHRYEASITNSENAPPGDYVCLIAAFSQDDPSIGLYNYVTTRIDETPVPDQQTIAGHIGDSLFLSGLDGSIVTVISHTPGGHVPSPVSVVNGEYSVNVVAGIYDLSVVPIDLNYGSQICTDIVVGSYENVRLDFGLHDPMQINPYDPMEDYVNWHEITGFAGRVVDAAGLPIPNATVELSSPDSWALSVVPQEFVQSELTDENGYFSMLNVPVVDTEGRELSEYIMRVGASGFVDAELEPLDAVSDHMQYNVIVLLDSPYGDPLWSESFEEHTGWNLYGYYHRQEYDPSVGNISFDKPYEFLAVPPDEMCGGAILPPSDGEWYLWYGVEADGNYLGLWDPSQDPYSGGLSTIEHRGSAVSPLIDLAGFTEARVEMDVAYEIECQQPKSFDGMRFSIDVGGDAEPVYIFNPFIDSMTHEYITSQRGYNRSPAWCRYSFDISEFAGGEIRLRFDFSTNDSRFNGGRGQFIDNIRVFAL